MEGELFPDIYVRRMAKSLVPPVCRILFYAALSLFSPWAHAQVAVPQSREEITLSFAPLVKKAAPAVVNIYTDKAVTADSVSSDPLMRFFYGPNGQQAPRGRQEQSLGSGVLTSAEGAIVTCRHVIEGGSKIKVVLLDKREFDAEILYQDPKTDLAILKIDAGSERLPYLETMDSDELEVGDMVLAIGNPFGVGQTVTSGIVSALARTTIGVSDYQFFIQTDASINPGNSGGALVNMQGKLAGINSAIYSRTGGSNGIGFAIPSNMVQAVANSVKGYGKVVRPWIGVKTQDVTKAIAESLGLKRPSGALVTGLYRGGPAEGAGLRVGDVVLKVGAHDIDDQQALRFRIATLAVGSQAQLTVYRNGNFIRLPIRLEPPIEVPRRDPRTLQGNNPFQGARIVNVSPAVSDEMGLPYDSQGVAVEFVGEGVAMRTGLEEKDVILAVNGVNIVSTQQMDQLLRTSATRTWQAAIKRGSKILTMAWGL
jgi:Do/DeqQ family serine protease